MILKPSDLKKLKKSGYVLLQEINEDILTLVAYLEKGLNESFSAEISKLKPKTEALGNLVTLSSEYGYGFFPYHTDGAHFRVPPRYIILRCLSEKSVTCTLLLDSVDVKNYPDWKEIMEHEIYTVKAENQTLYTSLINKILSPGNNIFRYNQLIMKNVSNDDKRFENLLGKLEPVKISWVKNKTLILDNWRFLHAREEVSVNEINDRLLERTYLFIKYI